MKKSLLNVITLALVIINLILTVLLTFSLVSTSKKTDSFISKVAGIIDLDVAGVTNTDTNSGAVGISDQETVAVTLNDSSKITISIMDDSGKVHQAQVSVSITLNKKSKDYESLRATVVENGMSIIVSEINKVISSYSYNVVLSSKENMKSQILTSLQDKFQTDMIYGVDFTGFVVQ